MKKDACRIIFYGTPDFAVGSLKILVENNYHIVAVVTAPDKAAGRGKKIHQSAVKQYALSQNLRILQPENLKSEEFIQSLRDLKPDLQIVVAFRMLPEVVWNMPPMGTFNLHGSLLPQYRGAAPINWAIINGEEQTGVTTFMLKHEIDTGNIISQKSTTISPTDNVGTVHDRLMSIGAELVMQTVEKLLQGNVILQTQDELAQGQTLRHAPKIFKNDCRINWKHSAKSIDCFIRGLSPYPAAWTQVGTNEDTPIRSLKIFRAQILPSQEQYPTGAVITDKKTFLHVATGDGLLALLDLQMEGKKRMLIEDFLCGYQAVVSDFHFH